jgi:hypothetical protein
MIEFLSYLTNKAKSLQAKLPKAFKNAYTTPYALGTMEDMNREQMNVGSTRDQDNIAPKYSKDYAAYKKRLGRSVKGAPFVPNLRLTGQFQQALYAKAVSSGVQFDSRDKKTNKLDKRYKRIFGLAVHNIAVLQNDARIQKDIINGII